MAWLRRPGFVHGLVLVTTLGCGDDGPTGEVQADAAVVDAAAEIDAAVDAASAQPSLPMDSGGALLDAQSSLNTARDGAVDATARDGGAAPVDTRGNGASTVGPNYTRQPDLTDRGAPKGRLFGGADSPIVLKSSDSKIFQGNDATLLPMHQHPFMRSLQVYVPARYRNGDKAPVLVLQDGPGPITSISRALDNLTISADPDRRLPPFVVVAVQNGGSDSKGSERGLEYDTMSDRYARFIHTEVLPFVVSHPAIRAVYPNFAITDDPEGRAAMGCSSGGAAAFTMGWFRPDLFRRIVSYSTTLVDQQDDDAAEEKAYPLGAWEYHSGMMLIAKAEKKPLRIFLHVSDRDLGFDAPESGHHNWVLANQKTAAALAQKGYPYRFVTANSAGHCEGKVYDATLADTLLWVWRGYTAP